MPRLSAIVIVLLCLAGFAASCGEDVSSPQEPGQLGGDEEAPDNFIPIFSEVCQPEESQMEAANALLLGILETSELWGDHTLELCSETSCAPCDPTSNPVLEVLRDAATWMHPDSVAMLELPAFDGSTDPTRKLESYFNQALDYPWRQLILATPTGATGDTALTFVHGVNRYTTTGEGYDGQVCSADAPCHWTSLAFDSLDTSCSKFNALLPVSLDADKQMTSAGQTDSKFGFWVPLVESFPDPMSFASDPAIEADVAFQDWLDGHPDIQVSLGELQITSTVIAEGHTWEDGKVTPAQCVTLSGTFDASRFGVGDDLDGVSEIDGPLMLGLMKDANALSSYADADGKISAKLSMKIVKFTYP